MSIAAGQAEALCPIIVQEIFYLHERGNVIAWFCALQTLGTAALIVSSSYLANDLGWRWWYGVFGCLSGAIAVLSILFVVETKYERTLEALSKSWPNSLFGSDANIAQLAKVSTRTERWFR